MQFLINLKNLYLIKKIGRYIAPFWPWPIPVSLGSKTLYVDLRSAVGRGIFVKGVFDDEVFVPLRKSIKPDTVFIDIGANVGYYSLLALDCVGINGEIHAFEIDPRPLACLKKTVEKNRLNNFFVHDIAVGESNGTAFLQMQKDCGHSSAGSGLLGIPVPMSTLDSFLPKFKDKHVSALKLDIEGGELAVLHGAKQILSAYRPTVVCEVVEEHLQKHGHSTEQLVDYMTSLGYTCSWLEGVHTPTIVAVPSEASS